MTVFAYLRISTTDKNQTVENQRHAIEQMGWKVDYAYADEGVSGSIKAQERPQFKAMSAAMTEGSVLVVSALDRLGRDAEDILNTINTFERRKIKVNILQFGSTDVTSPMGKLLVGILASLAEMERNNIKERTRNAMARLKAEGVYAGPPLKIVPEHLEEMAKLRKEASLDNLAERFQYDRATIHRNLKKWGGSLEEYKKEYNARKDQYARVGL